jgi:hypothetical protein
MTSQATPLIGTLFQQNTPLTNVIAHFVFSSGAPSINTKPLRIHSLIPKTRASVQICIHPYREIEQHLQENSHVF